MSLRYIGSRVETWPESLCYLDIKDILKVNMVPHTHAHTSNYFSSFFIMFLYIVGFLCHICKFVNWSPTGQAEPSVGASVTGIEMFNNYQNA